MSASAENIRPEPDQVLLDIAHYVDQYEVDNPGAYEAARYCLMDALGCAVQGLDAPECHADGFLSPYRCAP